MRLQKCMMPHMQWQLTAEQCTIDLNICRAIVLEWKGFENRWERQRQRTGRIACVDENERMKFGISWRVAEVTPKARENGFGEEWTPVNRKRCRFNLLTQTLYLCLLFACPTSNLFASSCWAVHKFIRMMQFICSVALVSTTLLVVWCGTRAL